MHVFSPDNSNVSIYMTDACAGSSPLVARAALGLLRVCQRLLPYKEDTAEGLLKSLHLVLRLNPSVAWDLASRIAAEVPSSSFVLLICCP